MVGLTKVVGLETAGSGVTCNAVCPGWVLTPLVEKQISDIAAENASISQKAAAPEEEPVVAREATVPVNFASPEQTWRHGRVPVLAAWLRIPDHGHGDLRRGGWTARCQP